MWLSDSFSHFIIHSQHICSKVSTASSLRVSHLATINQRLIKIWPFSFFKIVVFQKKNPIAHSFTWPFIVLGSQSINRYTNFWKYTSKAHEYLELFKNYYRSNILIDLTRCQDNKEYLINVIFSLENQNLLGCRVTKHLGFPGTKILLGSISQDIWER